MMAEILCAALSGGAMTTEIGGLRVRGRGMRVSQMYLAISVDRFMPVADFTARIEKLVASAKSSPPAAGFDEVVVAGELEWRAEEQRRREGIPLSDGTWRTLLEAAASLGVAVPAH
jgi:LDH2 family malate/lactate/ureidoglycolate dehydrogenase